MSVLQIIKDLIGKEDVNWGDSSTTIARETHTGGSINMSFVDAEAIPSTGLGGEIGDHLHKQNTDSLTTSTQFGINSTGNSVTLDGTGLSASRSFTFPDTSNQALVGATDLAADSTGLGASLVGVQLASSPFFGTDVQAVLTEIQTDLEVVEAVAHSPGQKNGFRLGFSSSSAITIGGGAWAHNGTTNRQVTLNSQITFTLGSGGSNSTSTDLGQYEVHYIYIDDSAIV